MFTPKEVRFLCQQHNGMVSMDLESLRIPPRILQGILERRAKRLGRSFAEFRSENGIPEPVRTTPPADPGLIAQIDAEKVF